ncbi:MAG TPA: transcriptional regulator ManR, partial [Clostridiaceae bacterium]|nr:transcriptional regulator ManR [Clostridiaceae bacterium]
MISLNMRQIEFIKRLLGEKDYKTISSFADSLKVSSKTLQKDLAVIEKYLNHFNVSLDRKPGTGIKIINADKAKLLLNNSIQRQERGCSQIPINQRRVEITKDLLIDSNTTTSLQKLSQKYFVSKTSIINDLAYIEKWLSEFGLKLEKNTNGTKVEGAEIDIRRAISSLLFEYSKGDDGYRNIEELSERLDASSLNALSELFERDKIIYVNRLLVELEKKYNCRLDDPYYINLLTHILITLTRCLGGKQIKVDVRNKVDSLKFERAYKEAVEVVNKLNKDFQLDLGESEVYYLYQYFVSSGLIKNITDEADEVLNKLNRKAELFAEKITKCMEKVMHINILNDEVVMEGLMMHIRPMLNRLDYDIKISNPLMGEIRKEYFEILNICKAAALMVSRDLKLKAIPIDEIGYLTLYYQLALERSVIKKRILVVCYSGYGTSHLLATRIRRAFPDWEIAGVISVSMLSKRNMKDIDFIVSTVPIDVKEKPYILVSTFLNDQDINNISKLIKEKAVETNERQTGTMY